MSDAKWEPGRVPTVEDVSTWEAIGMLCYWWRRDSIAGVEAVAVSLDEDGQLIFQAPGDEGAYPVARSLVNWVGPVSSPDAPDGVALARMIDVMWSRNLHRGPDGPEADEELSDEALSIWRAARAILAKAEG